MLRLPERDFSSKISKIDLILIDFGSGLYVSGITGIPDIQAFVRVAGDTPSYWNQ